MRKAMLPSIAAVVALSACAQSRGENGGPAVSRDYPVGAFDQVELAGSYDVQVRTGAKASVSATGPQSAIDRLEIEVRDNRLIIQSKKSKSWFGMGRHNDDVRVTVTVPQLNAASLAGSGALSVDKVKGERFDGEIAGSGDLKLGAIEVSQLKLSIAGSGGVTAASGKAVSADYEIAGSGDLDAKAVAADDVKVSIAGSGGVKAQATKTADVSILGSGDVAISGGAKCNVHKAGSGEVNCS
jgi:hypothetical protein